MRSRGWTSPPPPQHTEAQRDDAYGWKPGPVDESGLGWQTSLSGPFAGTCEGVSTVTCPRCDGLLVHEHLLDHREGSLSGCHGFRCLNCGAIHDNVIHMNRRVPPSLKRVRSSVAGLVLASRKGTSLERLQYSKDRSGNSQAERTIAVHR